MKKQDRTPPMHIIAHIHTDFPAKFGIPRQSGLIDSCAPPLSSRRSTATPTRCAALRDIPIFG